MSLAGPLILVFTIALWIVLIWAGWTFIFTGSENALIDTRDRGPISWAERIYFVAYTMFTLGNGDFAPADGVWQIATALMTASGMLSVTLIVTYVLSIIGAVVEKRSFASTVTGVGNRGEAFVRAGWNATTSTNSIYCSIRLRRISVASPSSTRPTRFSTTTTVNGHRILHPWLSPFSTRL